MLLDRLPFHCLCVVVVKLDNDEMNAPECLCVCVCTWVSSRCVWAPTWARVLLNPCPCASAAYVRCLSPPWSVTCLTCCLLTQGNWISSWHFFRASLHSWCHSTETFVSACDALLPPTARESIKTTRVSNWHLFSITQSLKMFLWKKYRYEINCTGLWWSPTLHYI